MNSQFNRELIIKLARDNPIVQGYLSAYESHFLTYEQTLIAMVSSLVGHNNFLSESLMRKKETEIPLRVAHNVPAVQEIQKIIQSWSEETE